MNFIKLSFTVLLYSIVISGMFYGKGLTDSIKVTTTDEAINLSRDVLENFMNENQVPGLSAAISIDGRLVWSEGLGYADLENGISATKHTKFRIASISKPITIAALALLYEHGKVDLDEAIQSYSPDYPQKRWKVTLRDLASHQAGIRSYLGDEFLNASHFNSVGRGVDIFRNDTLLFEPGTQFKYTSYGFNLISEVIEDAAKENFLSFMQKNIFNPLKMNSTTADHTDSLITHRASFYSVSKDGRILNSKFVDNSNKWAGGGFLSTSEDLINFGSSFLTENLLKKSTIDLFWKTRLTKAGKATNYALGWESKIDEFGVRWVGHAGGAMGGRSMLIIYPEDKIVVAVITNLGPAKAPVRESQIIANIFRQLSKNVKIAR